MMRFHAPRLSSALALPLALVACHSTPRPAAGTEPRDPTPTPAAFDPDATDAGESSGAPGDERAARAIERIRAGDFEGARDVLTAILVERHLGRTRELLAAGAPEDALLEVDEVLALDPHLATGRLLKADASLALAEKGMARGGGALLVQGSLLDALTYYERSGDTVEALLGASRAAAYLARTEEALDFAQRAMAKLAGGPEPEGLPVVPERVLSEAAFNAFVKAKSEEVEAEVVRERFTVAEGALSSLLGRTPDDPWVWSTLSDLYVWEGKLDDARGVLERGLDRAPNDEGLLRRLDDVARRAGGAAESAAAFTALDERHPDVPLAIWYEAVARFDIDVEEVMATFAEDYESPADPEALPRSIATTEGRFRACRTLESSYTASCKGYEVMCRAALGWVRYGQKEYAAAVTAFRSMDEVTERGMEWQLEGRLLSGVIGLHLCAKDQGDAGDPLTAGEIYEILHAYQPEDSNWANNAGFFLRDAAVGTEAFGRRLCQAARGELTQEETLAALRERAKLDPALAGTPEEKDAFEAEADAAMVRARAIMERSDAAYREAAALAPDDVRIVNDTALILVYYLHRDLDYAEKILLHCVAQGEEQRKDEGLTKEQRFELENAWGDAHENLGVLYAVHEKDAAKAIPWFEKAAEIGPNPRPNVTNIWLPGLRALAPGADPDLLHLREWARPCAAPDR